MAYFKAIIADVEQLFIEGFKHILSSLKDHEVEIVDSFSKASDVSEYLNNNTVDLIFMDLNLEDEDGLEFIPTIRNAFPELKICVITAYTDHKFVRSALQKGANGFFSKKSTSAELEKCFEEMIIGDTFLSNGLFITPPARAPKVLTGNGYNGRPKDRYVLRQKLTRREQEVLNLITKALNNKEIAQELYISHQTVGVHRKNIMRKLGVRNTVNLIKFAMDNELV